MTNSHTQPAAAAVEARGWGWRHSTRRAWAIDGLSLTITPGERVLLLGPSGAGKSTLIQALAGVLGGAEEGEHHGELLVDGGAPTAGRSGLLLQDPDAQMILARVGDDVAFGCENLGVPRAEIWERVAEALDDVGLDLPLDHSTSKLSGGQKQRLALAGVLAMRPGLLLLDEPTANLDPGGVREVRDAVGRVLDRSGATLIVIEHRVDTWLDLVDRVVVLAPGGAILADGDPGTVLRENAEALRDAGVWLPAGLRTPVEPRVRSDATVPSVAATPLDGPEAARPTEPLLRTDRLAVSRVRGVPVQSGLEIRIHPGEVLAIVGENGAGKSTLALTLAGLLRPESGAVIAEPALDAGAGATPIRWRSRDLLARIATVFQDPEHQFLTATVRAELEVGPRRLGLTPELIAERVDEVLVRLRLDHLARAHPFSLSGGEKRRLSVATALVCAPRILVLDEPTFGQDARTWRELVALIGGLRDSGTAIIAVSHDVDFVTALADRTLRLEVAA